MLNRKFFTAQKSTLIALTLLLLLAMGCKKNNEMSAQQQQNASSIADYIHGLQYNPDAILNVQNIASGSSQTGETGTDDLGTSVSGGYKISCVKKSYSMKENFEDVAILRPTNGVIFPGALVYGDTSMLDGNPTPLQVSRAPVNLHVDLPGIGDAGNITVSNPGNGTVQAKIDGALQYWNNNAYKDGYVNPAYASYQASTSYSSQQLALSLGLNVKWMGNDVASQFNYSTTSTKTVAMMVFKQGFYSVTMNTPASPAEVFGSDVSVDKVKSIIDNNTPPAYVQSVVYGRIIMFRMESSTKETSTDMELALQYATGVTNVTGSAETHIKSILANSSTTIVLIGGNAAVATQAVSAQNFGDLQNIIKGQNAVYNKSNPGVPIAYTIKYLKDNRIARMGYSTNYSVEECSTALVPGQPLSVYCEAGFVSHFTITGKHADGSAFSFASGDISLGKTVTKMVPDGANGITLKVEYYAVAWHALKSYHYAIPEKHCFKTYGTVFSPQIAAINCQ